jgi:hypothetical protein
MFTWAVGSQQVKNSHRRPSQKQSTGKPLRILFENRWPAIVAPRKFPRTEAVEEVKAANQNRNNYGASDNEGPKLLDLNRDSDGDKKIRMAVG